MFSSGSKQTLEHSTKQCFCLTVECWVATFAAQPTWQRKHSSWLFVREQSSRIELRAKDARQKLAGISGIDSYWFNIAQVNRVLIVAKSSTTRTDY